MYPDGVQYVDLARQFSAVGVAGLLNGCWSPLYPVLLAGTWAVLHPSPYWLYPTVQIVNLVDYVIAVAAFDYFLRCVLRFREGRPPPSGFSLVPPAAFVVSSYAAFLIVVGYLLNVRTMTPDMLVAAGIFAVSGLLLAAEDGGWTRGRTALVGAVLAVGYVAKTVMFPVGILYAMSAVALAATRAARRAA